MTKSNKSSTEESKEGVRESCTGSKDGGGEDRILDLLLKDPTKSIREIAEGANSYRQKIWRKKKQLEEDNTIWGYTAVVDEGSRGYVMYMALLKLKPMTGEMAEFIMERQKRNEAKRQNVRIINLLYLNGEYDWLVMFSAPDHATARRYYDSLRTAYADYLLEKPVIVDVNFAVVREGKLNPQVEKLYDFVPR